MGNIYFDEFIERQLQEKILNFMADDLNKTEVRNEL